MVKTWKRTKDPDEVIDYGVGWAKDLGGDQIEGSEWEVPVGLTLVSGNFGVTTTTARFAGGTIGEDYVNVNRITTQSGQVMDLSVKLKCRER